MKFLNSITKFFKAVGNAGKEEIKEIKSLVPSDEQYAKGKAASVVAIAALASAGIPIAAAAEPIIAKVFAYCLADLEAGIEDNQKLIIERVMQELKKS